MRRQIAIMTLGIGSMALAGAALLWRTLTQLPDWYHQPTIQTEAPQILSQQDFDESSERHQLEKLLKQKLASPSEDSIHEASVRLDEREVNKLILVSAHQSMETQPYIDGVKGIKTEISEQTIKSEIVINFSEINRDRLPSHQAQVLDELASQFPFFADKDILLSFIGMPKLEAGQLQLDPAMKVAIGGFDFTLADLFGRFGVDMTMTSVPINISELNIQSVKYTDGALLLMGQG